MAIVDGGLGGVGACGGQLLGVWGFLMAVGCWLARLECKLLNPTFLACFSSLLDNVLACAGALEQVLESESERVRDLLLINLSDG